MAAYRVLLIALLLGLFGGVWAPAAGAAEEHRQLVQDFLTAYFRQDMAGVRRYLPSQSEKLLCAYPFRGEVKLAQPKVDDNQALVEFTATASDDRVPAKGGILLREVDSRWLVRQVLFYDRVPRLFGLPTRSVTEGDRAQERTVRAITQAYVTAWQANDGKAMLGLWYDWPHSEKDPIQGLSLTSLQVQPMIAVGSDQFVRYSARLTYRWGILAYSMVFKGGVMLFQHDGAWRVRANAMCFDF